VVPNKLLFSLYCLF